jgi:transcriptional regulator with XRE-family HTH domain
MHSADLLKEARRRAGLTQAELAERSGRPQSTIARWESGRVQPSLESLRDAIRACGLELGFTIANFDDSYIPFIERNLALLPSERLAKAVHVANVFRDMRPKIERARVG